MIASRLKLSRKDTKKLGIRDVYSIHKVIYSLFPAVEGQNRDFLYADKGGDFHFHQILILSKREPILPEFGMIESKIIPEKFLSYDHYGFEIRLNPTKRDKNTTKIIAIRGKEELLNWFTEKAPAFGFNVVKENLQVQNIGVQRFEKNGVTVTQGEATFIGKLVVCNRKSFIQSFKEGIGRAKSFGFGLLQIIPLQG